MSFSEETMQKFIKIVENSARLAENNPKVFETINLANGMRIEAREDGVYLAGVSPDGGEINTRLCDEYGVTEAELANEATFAQAAWMDWLDRELKGISIQEYGDTYNSFVVLEDGQVAYWGVADGSFSCEFPEYNLGYTSKLYFTTPDTLYDGYFETDQPVYFKGDDTDGGVFNPVENTRYTIAFEYDGVNLIANVLGVPV